MSQKVLFVFKNCKIVTNRNGYQHKKSNYFSYTRLTQMLLKYVKNSGTYLPRYYFYGK